VPRQAGISAALTAPPLSLSSVSNNGGEDKRLSLPFRTTIVGKAITTADSLSTPDGKSIRGLCKPAADSHSLLRDANLDFAQAGELKTSLVAPHATCGMYLHLPG
jgi:hypothetical protein